MLKRVIVMLFVMSIMGGAYAETICASGQYNTGTSCAECPAGYPNSDPDAVSWNDCYRRADVVECPKTVPDGCVDIECYDCPQTTDCEYRVYNGAEYPWQESDGRIESTCGECKIRCLDECSAGKFLNGTSCMSCPAAYPYVAPGAVSWNDCYRLSDYALCPDAVPDGYVATECYDCPPVTDCEYRVYSNATYPWEEGGDGRTETICTDAAQMCRVRYLTECPAGKYLDGTSCAECPAGYPNSEPGATAITDCYRSADYDIKCDTTVPDGCVDTECYDCPQTPDCYRVYYVAATYPWEEPGGRIESTCGECKTRCLDKCAAGKYFDGTSCAECPAGYPNSDPGATAITQCYSDTKYRPWTGKQLCNIPAGCMSATCDYGNCTAECEYVAYHNGEPEPVYPWDPQPGDGEIKSGCKTNDADCVANVSVYSLPGYAVGDTACTLCPKNTYSVGGLNATCIACPNGLSSPVGATSFDDCGRILNYKYNNEPTRQIYLGGRKKTPLALAVKVYDRVFYGNLINVDVANSGDFMIGISGKKYKLYDTVFDIEMPFFMTTAADTQYIRFYLSAIGEFDLYCGDGSPVQKIVRTNTITDAYSCEYKTPGQYIIRLGRRSVTGYSSSAPVIQGDASWKSIVQISGSLGAVFPTIGDGGAGNQPIFSNLFANSGIKGSIPQHLFAGIHGEPVDNMFNATFKNCKYLIGEIPIGLFGDLDNVWATDMFYETFYGCSGLRGYSARTGNGTPLYDYYGDAAKCSTPASELPWDPPAGACMTYQGASNLADYGKLSDMWK